jgi:hypothetical protein
MNGTESAVFLVAKLCQNVFEKKNIQSRFPYFSKKSPKDELQERPKCTTITYNMRAEFFLKRNFRHLANFPGKEIVKNHHVSRHCSSKAARMI